MASRLEEDLTCPICRELFRDPVVVSCSHSFCKVCLENWWRDKPIKTCAVCKRRSSRDFPPLNLVLRNLVQTFAEQREHTPAEDHLCSLHSEKLRLFCLDHEEPVCLVCRDSRIHKDHRFSPIEEVAEDLREHLRKSIKSLRDKLQVLTGKKEEFEDTAVYITAQVQQTKAQIQEQFDKLHQFLLEEEDSRIKALKEEEEQKTQRIKDKMVAVSREMEAVSKTIAETEEELRATDTFFVLQYKSTVEILQDRTLVEEPQMEPGVLIDQTKHLGNLGFNIWEKMRRLVKFYPVILDQNSADPELMLSQDLSSVRCGERQRLPQNPERSKDHIVFGSKVFRSGIHSWDVEVGDSKSWSAGVTGHVLREEKTETGCWFINVINGKYSAYSHPDTDKPLSVMSLQRLRVKLDFDRRTLTFSDPIINTDLSTHTFTDTFTDGLVPYFFTDDNIPLEILPKDITVKCKY
ncbi:LOW QUALITY PROTEIN: E3 ubiquitin-protein ligase TRIM35-like [Periophthalmus magnuspinnatus]|uniref:LOW QUALITY PROTEIN: E3 ubiquitin-protein ligase TRIM35-like n=1 Tax=Periophthalmus magnuspinnatus TaxID=409849 RepID=UPI0024366152|nr:LOW QUALITY PROTEIN: E3 ubiquitin-protein ligase TRIM35-like [Periophthalmus magnuspinnatus]